MRREFVDNAGQGLRQLLEEFLFRHPRSLGEGFEDVWPKRVSNLARRNGFVRSGANPGVGRFSLSALPKAIEQAAQSIEQTATLILGRARFARLGWRWFSIASLEQRTRSQQCQKCKHQRLGNTSLGNAEPNISSSRPIFCSCCCRVETDAVVSHRSPPAEGVINP
jgi:hypothetical protein